MPEIRGEDPERLPVYYVRILTQHDIGKNLILSHLDVSDSDTQAENLLELELDGRTDLSELVGEVFGVGHRGGELSSLSTKKHVRKWSQKRKKLYVPFERPGPSKRGICLMRASEARKASYFLASFFTSFLFLLSLHPVLST